MQTDTGRIRRLLVGFVLGALLVAGYTAYARVTGGGSFDTGANLGKINKDARTVGDPRTTPYPDSRTRNANRKPRQVTFIVRQVSSQTKRINVVSSVDADKKSATAVRQATWKRNVYSVRPGAVLYLSAGIVPNDQADPKAGPLECIVVVDGLVYREHFGRHPYNLGDLTCQASAVVP